MDDLLSHMSSSTRSPINNPVFLLIFKFLILQNRKNLFYNFCIENFLCTQFLGLAL